MKRAIPMMMIVALAGCASSAVRLAGTVGARTAQTPADVQPGFHDFDVKVDDWLWHDDSAAGRKGPSWLASLAPVASATLSVELRFAGGPTERIVVHLDDARVEEETERAREQDSNAIRYQMRSRQLLEVDDRFLLELRERSNRHGSLEKVIVRAEAPGRAPVERSWKMTDGELEATFAAVLADARNGCAGR